MAEIDVEEIKAAVNRGLTLLVEAGKDLASINLDLLDEADNRYTVLVQVYGRVYDEAIIAATKELWKEDEIEALLSFRRRSFYIEDWARLYGFLPVYQHYTWSTFAELDYIFDIVVSNYTLAWKEAIADKLAPVPSNDDWPLEI